MATADELLAALTNSDEDEKILIIDNDLRTISIPKSIKALGVESDDEVHRLYFQMPRTCGDVDLSTFNIRINYMNAKREGDIYVVTDKKTLSDSITFSWLVGRNALAYKGNVNFIVCLKESNASGDVLREFNTTVASLPVLEGLEVDPAYLEGELHDVLEQLLSLTVAKVAEVEAAGASQIAKVQQESTKQQANIVEKGAQVLATIPAEYQTTAKLADEGVRSKADAITRTVEGKHIEVNDASDDNLRGLKLFGKTTQQTYSGKNLFKPNAETVTLSGGTLTVTEDGTVTLNGTFTANTSRNIGTFKASSGFVVIPNWSSESSRNGSYLFFGMNDASHYVNVGKTSFSNLTAGTNGSTVTLTIVIIAGTYSNVTTKPLIQLSTITDDTYEPYTGGKAAPNPDYPQPLVSPGDGGAINTTVAGKNLLPYPYRFTSGTQNGVTYKTNDDGSVTYNGTATAQMNPYFVEKLLLKKGTYTISGSPKGSSWTTYLLLVQTGDFSTVIAEDFGKGKTFTLNEDTRVNVCFIVANGYTVSNLTVYPMLALGTTAADYEPYKSNHTITASTPNGLPGIPVESGGNHVDENGQQWICDEIDFASGVYVQRIGEVVYTGDESGINYDTTRDTILTVVTNDVRTDSVVSHVACTHFADADRTGHINIYGGVAVRTGGVGLAFGLDIGTTASEVPSADRVPMFKGFLKEQYENGTPVTAKYALATPISTPLSAADLASFKAAKTAKPYTQIFNDSDVEMEASYNADTEIYIDNKIAERTPRNSYVAPAIVETKSGEVISVSDSSDDVVHGLKLFGKTKQFTTTGKNLFDDVAWFKKYNGVQQSDGSWMNVSANTTCFTNTARKSGAMYVTAIAKTESETGPFYIRTHYTDGTSEYAIILKPTNGFEAVTARTNPEKTVDYFIWTWGHGGDWWVKGVMISFVDNEYEPYTGGIALPNPDYPQELESAGESGSIDVTVAGKNLFDDIGWFESHGFTKQSDGSWLANQVSKTCWTNTAKQKGTMYITVIAKTDAKDYDPVPCYFLMYYTDGTYDVSRSIKDINGFTTLTFQTNPNKTVDYIKWTYGGTGVYYVKGVSISFVDGEYEPYKPLQTLTVSTPNGLNDVPMPDNVGDGFTYTYDYIDGDGKKRIADYVDEAKGVRVQRFKRYKVTQARDFYGVKNGFGQFSIMLPSDRKLGSYCLCTHYPVPIHYVGAEYTSPTKNGVIYKRISSAPGYLLVNHEGITTLEDCNAWLAENQPEFLYELETPIETPLTKAELAAYRAAALHTNYPSTTIYNDANAGQEVTYVADTKNWIKNQLSV